MAMGTDPVGDGCTLWLQGTWRHCCEAHDIAYGAGFDKLQADLDLGLCVAQTGHPLMAIVMVLGVLLFGWLFWKPKRPAAPPHPKATE